MQLLLGNANLIYRVIIIIVIYYNVQNLKRILSYMKLDICN